MSNVSPLEFDAHFSHIAFAKMTPLGGVASYGAEYEVFQCKRCLALVAWNDRAPHVEWHVNLEGKLR